MSKLGSKVCRAYHTFFEGYQVPVGASYGRSLVCGEEWFWVCDDYSGIKTGQLHVRFMKRSWASNQNCHVARITWHEILVGRTHPIYKEIMSIIKEIGGIPRVKSYEPPRKNKLPLECKFTIGLKKSQSEYIKKCGPLSTDNADKNHPINNYRSYWANGHDVVRGTVNYGGNIY